MVIFSLGAVPITALLISVLLQKEKWFDAELWGNFRRGILIFLPAAVLYFVIPAGKISYLNPWNLFLHYWVFHFLIFHGIAIGVFLLFFGFSGDGKDVSVFLFFAGFYALSGVVDTIDYFGDYNLYSLFLLPVLRVGLLITTTLLLVKMFEAFQFIKIPFLAGAIVSSCIPGIAALFYYLNMELLSITVTVLFLGGAVAAFIVFRE